MNEEILHRVFEAVQEHRACVVGMPVKDTIKVSDEKGFVVGTPDRNSLWLIQTPQVFEVSLVKKAYSRLMEMDTIKVTDDAMVVEQMLGEKVKLVEGSYQNIKITTPEDLLIASVLVQ